MINTLRLDSVLLGKVARTGCALVESSAVGLYRDRGR